ncbi:hypothetical protein ASPWEDRAFT_172675 [Aspergillus wentii DTO 134E9]|uniref:FAD-binding PCMH-type domain-containing protein n=1 Tax=Aspergillus wentii DTO 134E9 TaxID=1073089 RepID=A0A1L9RM40_ASPWE|nr:uncharacterized protein ASPWEDRAFT_172675 [Aspergillus wentii DTO 134E9]KAI9929661.1 hypothetical protein MW887_001136 [Aspergillus wentii]OJJ35888.1 hypothetical protein ASPWEDRAFT_172675 [Aspergillus wentii DTO 134E9]
MTNIHPQLASLEAFLENHPAIKYIPPSSPNYSTARKIFNCSRPDNPLAIVQPQSATDVSVIVKYAKLNNLPFTIRVGGHNLEGRSLVEGALLIDLRALNGVKIADDRQTAIVQGGIIQAELGKKLWDEGLVTPVGTTPSVGYVGWAVYGGYGSFSGHWGLGVDQIVGATVVNPEGEIITADESLLRGIRGAGGLFGVIVDLTIKVYPLKTLLTGALMFDSQDIGKTFIDFNAAYEKFKAEEPLPQQLTVQQIVFNAPPGRTFGVLFFWSGADIEQGQRWSEKIARLGPVIVNTIATTGIPEWMIANGALVPPSVYGAARTHSVRRISPQVAEAIARHLVNMPADPGTMLSVHELRGVSAEAKSDSVFATREPHFMLEMCGFATAEIGKAASEKWAIQLAEDIGQTDASNIVSTAYISLYNMADAAPADVLAKTYGGNARDVTELKESFDPSNVFSLTVPLLR